jgi:2-oxoglutarate ferredoxin oxidoreductase subunit beta
MKSQDYRTSLKPVWCAGCGDYGVLKGLTQALADLDIPPERLAIISGIGCSSRMVGYLDAYSFNTLHGRALPIATGLKVSRPELTTVVVGGDGDGFSIGMGHIPAAVRRNVDMTYAVLDNGIYGLTKGQASPTTATDFKIEHGLSGVDDQPLNPVLMLLSMGCGFVARTHAGNLKHLRAMFKEAIEYPGFAFIHTLAGCATYQSKAYAHEIQQRCDILPGDYDPADFMAAIRAAQEDRFKLGVIYRREPVGVPVSELPVIADASAHAAAMEKYDEKGQDWVPGE